MRLSQRIALNTLALGATDIFGRILSFLLVVAIARHYAPETFGFYTFALSFVELLIILADLGISKLAVRDIAANPDQTGQLFGALGILKLFYSICSICIVLAVLSLLKYQAVVFSLTVVFSIRSIFDSFSGFCFSIFKAHQRMDYIPPLNLGAVLLNIAAGFSALLLDLEILYIAYAFAIVAAGKLMLSLSLVSRKFARPRLEMDLSALLRLARAALPFGVGSLLVRISTRVDTLMLSKLATMVVVGYYNAAYNLVIVLLFLPGAFNEAIFPVMSRFSRTSSADFQMTLDRAVKYSYIIGVPMSTGVFALAEPIITLFYGPAYSDSVWPLQILIWTLASSFGTFILTTTLNSSRKEILVTWIVLVCCGVNIAGNVFLIPRWGAAGASLMTLVTELCFFSLSLLAVRKYVLRPHVFRYLLRPALASALMYAVLLGVRHLFIAVPVLVGVLTYTAALLLLGTFDSTDRALLKNMMDRTAPLKPGPKGRR